MQKKDETTKVKCDNYKESKSIHRILLEFNITILMSKHQR